MMLLVETRQIVVLHVRHAFWQISLTYFAKQQREKKTKKNKFEPSPDLAFYIILLFKVKKKAKQVFKTLLKF